MPPTLRVRIRNGTVLSGAGQVYTGHYVDAAQAFVAVGAQKEDLLTQIRETAYSIQPEMK